MSHFYFKKL